MNKIKKLLYNADPSANATNKETLRDKFLSHTEELVFPKSKHNWARPVLTVACVCLLIVCVIQTDFAQAGISYVKDIFFTKEVNIDPEDITGDAIRIQVQLTDEEIIASGGYIDKTNVGRSLEQVELSAEEIQNALGRYFKIPNFYVGQFSDYSLLRSVKNLNLDSEDAFNVELTIYSPDYNKTIRLKVFTLAENSLGVIPEGTEITKYTMNEIEIYSFYGKFKNMKNFVFTFDDFIYWIEFDGEPTDEEFAEMIGSMN